MIKKPLAILMSAAISLAALTGACSAGGSPAQNPAGAGSETPPAAAVAAPPAASAAQPPDSTDAAARTVYPLTIDNYDADGGAFVQVFPKAPERVVATTQANIEIMLKLGLGDRLVGVANIISDFPADLQAEAASLNEISKQWPPMEVVLGVSPDFVMGRAFDFNEGEYGLGTVRSYSDMGINTFIWASSSITGDPTMEDIISDIRVIGQIFDAQARANAFADELQARLDQVKASLPAQAGEKKALMITDFDGSTYGQYGAKAKLQNDLLAKLGYVNATEQAGNSLGLETMVAISPDIIIYIEYDGSALEPQEAINSLLAQDALRGVPAIANNAVYRVPFNNIMGHGYCTIEGLTQLAEQIYPN
ncbi:MAG: ABC transporter substrate-binding protein [Peptococcaceae bacterium]|jgi:iron complex transport system substrate-binding protein|nr:ABC transporter substrate-binding protein [Peptococcaceae bacterium]